MQALRALPPPPSDVYGPHYLADTIVRLSLATTESTPALITSAVEAYTKNLPKLATSKTVFTRSSLLMRNILAFSMGLNLEGEVEVKSVRKLFDTCRTLVSGFIFNPCEGVETKSDDDGFQENVGSNPSILSFGDGLSDSDEETDNSMFTQSAKRRRVDHDEDQNGSAGEGGDKDKRRRKKRTDDWVFPDSSSGLLLVSILYFLSPNKDTLKFVADSYAWPDETFKDKKGEPCLYHVASPSEIIDICKMWCTTAGVLSDRRLSPSSASSYGGGGGDSDSDDEDMDDDDENEQKITVPYLITAMIRKARELSPPSSPHHTCGYDILAKLVEVGEGKFLKDDVGDIMACVATDHKPLRKSVKVRPGLKALQMKCMNSVFEKAQGRLQREAKKVTVSQLFSDIKNLSEVVRSQAVSAVGTAFSLSAGSAQKDMVQGIMGYLPPLPLSNEVEVRISERRETRSLESVFPGRRHPMQILSCI